MVCRYIWNLLMSFFMQWFHRCKCPLVFSLVLIRFPRENSSSPLPRVDVGVCVCVSVPIHIIHRYTHLQSSSLLIAQWYKKLAGRYVFSLRMYVYFHLVPLSSVKYFLLHLCMVCPSLEILWFIVIKEDFKWAETVTQLQGVKG